MMGVRLTVGALLLTLLGAPVRADDTLPSTFDVHALAQEAVALTQTPQVPALGLVIVHRGQPRLVEAWGVTKRVGGKPVDAHTVFRLASVSKGFTSAAAGLAIQDGALRWDTNAAELVKHARLSTPQATQMLTLASVLSQQTGLQPYNYGDKSLQNGASKAALDQQVAKAPLKCLPGHCYSYQNVTYQWAADMISASTKQTFEQFVEQRLLKPLGMADASFGLQALRASPSWAEPHVGGSKGATPVAPKPTYYLLPAAAGLNASASDMAHWLAAQGGYRPDVLDGPLLETLHAPRTSVPPFASGWRKERIWGQWYGMGWRVWNYRGTRVIMHAGAVQGYRSLVAMLPDKNLGVALLWNSQSGAPAKLLPKILDAAMADTRLLEPPPPATPTGGASQIPTGR